MKALETDGPTARGETPLVELHQVRQAAATLAGVAIHTPLVPFGPPEHRRYLKAESLQPIGAFKIRGAYVAVASLTPEERARGVITYSSGNHAQGVARAARLLGARAVVVMPSDAPEIKRARVAADGAEIVVVGTASDERQAVAERIAGERGLAIIPPFDDDRVIAGQGTVGLEIAEQVPDVATVIVPVGGGGLAAGVVTALAELRPDVRVVGVQAAHAASYPASLAAGHPLRAPELRTMADGIAIGMPGDLPFDVLARAGTQVRTVSEEDLSRALLLVAERAKLLVEPSGAAAVAALMAAPGEFTGPVVAILSGGNIDPQVLLRVVRHGLASAGRFLWLHLRIADRPGALADLLRDLAGTGANVMHVSHVRTQGELAVDEVAIEVQVETKGPDHCASVLATLRAGGYRLTD
jgi:threonine dehydratase